MRRRTAVYAAMAALAATLAFPALPSVCYARAPGRSEAAAQNAQAPPVEPKFKPDAKKANAAYKMGLNAEQRQNWQEAFEDYSDAVNFAPENHDYLMRREMARSQIVQAKMDDAEKKAVSGQLVEALAELRTARELDPTNSVLHDRLIELSALLPRKLDEPKATAGVAAPVRLQYAPGKRTFDYRGDAQGAYEEAAKQFGVEVAFDVDMRAGGVNMHFDNLDFLQTMDLLGESTGTFWRPLTRRLFFVSEDTPQKRKDYETSIVRTVLLPDSETPDQMTEITRLVREVAGITRTQLNTASRTLTMRAGPRAIAIATSMIDDLEKPLGEVVLEIEVLQVDRTSARQMGITPPQGATVYSISKQQIEQAENSTEGLVSVLAAIFGATASGTPNVPALVAFGGGASTFLATMPNASASLSSMLSLVRSGRRILLRAQDGQPATFFVGDRIPVSLAQFSASLGAPSGSIGGTIGQDFPVTNLTTGNEPQAVATGITHNSASGSSTNEDLVVANFQAATASVYLGKGDGTFAERVDYPTGAGPVALELADLNKDGSLDIATANQTANTVSILLGNGDGTFGAKVDLPTGKTPVAVVNGNFHDTNGKGDQDLAVVNFGDNTVSLFEGNGDGTFQTPTTIPTGHGPSAIVTGDFNLDGHLDFAVTNKTDNNVSVFLGNGDGTFQAPKTYATGTGPQAIEVGDFNADGVSDLAIANNTDNTVSILLGVKPADGTFHGQTTFPAGNGPTSIAVADYNGDGIEDMAIADQTDNAVSVLLGVGDGTFGSNLEIPVDQNPVSIATADFNGDGRPDAATANFDANTASVILNSSVIGESALATAGTQFPGVEYLDVGVKVKATPRIHPDNDVTVKLSLNISAVTGTAYNGIPVISNQEVEQTVRVHEDETSALAGIVVPQYTQSVNGTPGIAEIPGLGLAAGLQNTQTGDSELLILITPRMVRYPDRHDHIIYAGRGSLEGPGAMGPTREERQAVPVNENPPAGEAPPAEEPRLPAQQPGQPAQAEQQEPERPQAQPQEQP
ncbi:MAG: FG-GAP-like repeat-containing protein [Candidatus Acidiferrales bacterium]